MTGAEKLIQKNKEMIAYGMRKMKEASDKCYKEKKGNEVLG